MYLQCNLLHFLYEYKSSVNTHAIHNTIVFYNPIVVNIYGIDVPCCTYMHINSYELHTNTSKKYNVFQRRINYCFQITDSSFCQIKDQGQMNTKQCFQISCLIVNLKAAITIYNIYKVFQVLVSKLYVLCTMTLHKKEVFLQGLLHKA